MSLLDQTKYRIKAVLAATFSALVGVATWLVANPDTATAIQAVVPAPYDLFVPVALGILGTILVHQIPLGEKPVAPAKDDAPITELTDAPATTVIRTTPPVDDGY